MRPVPHSDELPVPKHPVNLLLCDDGDDDEEQDLTDPVIDCAGLDPTFEASCYFATPHLITQADLNDLTRDLKLSKRQAEILGSRLKGWNLVDKETKVCAFRDRHNDFVDFFSFEQEIAYCNDVNSVMDALGHNYNADEWRLFIDSSKVSLKAVLLHNGNKLPSIPLAHAAGMKETYNNMKLLLEKIKYKEHNWNVCCDLKVLSLLLGLQLGYTNFYCFLCEWDSRDRKNHYLKKQWPRRTLLTPGIKNVANTPLVATTKVFLPPLHIKLGLMKNFVKGMDRSGLGFMYLKQKFHRMSEAKIKEGIFVGPQIRELFRDQHFYCQLNQNELAAWTSFKSVCENFLGIHKSVNYEEVVEDLLKSYQTLQCNMSLKIHFLHSHLDFFPANLGAVSDEHGERFHQDIFQMEKRYQGKWSPHMLADYCWTIKRDVPEPKYSRNINTPHF